MKVREALLCINCDEIFRPHPAETACPACLSQHVVALRKWVKPLYNGVDIQKVKARNEQGPTGTAGE